MHTSVTVDIVSDLVCPWCYIGKRHLEAALASMGSSAPQVTVRWHPFQLNPDLQRAGMSRQTYVETKFGGAARAAQVYERIRLAGQATGLTLFFDRIERQPNTLAGHALVALAQEHGVGDAVVEALFHAYFVDGVFIGDVARLADIGAAQGLDRTRIETVLSDDTTLANIAAQDHAVRQQGISGVPFFLINEKFALSGAQPAEVIAKTIGRAMNGDLTP
jgi:predicted DsbA family dithiol-disulfide isomerase